MRQIWPDAEAHDDLCRVLMFRWRLNNPSRATDVAAFPCTCEPPRPWATHEIDHPGWCVLGDERHPWHECTVTRMVPVEKKE